MHSSEVRGERRAWESHWKQCTSDVVLHADLKRKQRQFAGEQTTAGDYDYFRDEIAYRLVDKLRVCTIRNLQLWPKLRMLVAFTGHFPDFPCSP
jgi:hypothetical protein